MVVVREKNPFRGAQCPHIPSCTMFALFETGPDLARWQVDYCRSAYTECARFKLTLLGKSVPIDLLPSGTLLRIHKDDK